MCNQCAAGGTGNGCECNRVGRACAFHVANSELLVECLLTELEGDGSCNTGIHKRVDGNGKRGIIVRRTCSHNIFTTAETDIYGAGDGVVGDDGVARDEDDCRDSVAARNQELVEQRQDTGITQRQVIGTAGGLLPCAIVNLVAERIVIDIIIASVGQLDIVVNGVAGCQAHCVEALGPLNSGIDVRHIGDIYKDSLFSTLAAHRL